MAAEERTPHGEPQAEPPNGNGVPEIVQELSAFNNATPADLARLALQGEMADEIVPTAEGITLFEGKRAQLHRASGQQKSLLQLRLDRINKTKPSRQN